MKKLHSTYPIGQLLIALFTHSGLNLPQFLTAIGYGNVNNGIRHFQSFLTTGLGPSLLLERLEQSNYAPHTKALTMIAHQHIEQYNQELYLRYGLVADDFKEEFRPFLHAVPGLANLETISLYAQSGEFASHTITFAKNIARLPLEDHYKLVGASVRRNYEQTNGTICFLGPICSYLYYHSWDEPPLAFSVTGELLGIADNGIVPRMRVEKVSRLLDEELLEAVLQTREIQTLH
jgi:hypothetical protein